MNRSDWTFFGIIGLILLFASLVAYGYLVVIGAA